jgi:hypothetical protein
MAVNDVWKLTLKSQLFGNSVQNSFHFRTKTTGDRTLAEAQALADAMKNQLRAMQADDVVYQTWELREVHSSRVIYDASLCSRQGGFLYDGVLTGTLTGAGTSQPLPPQTAVVFTWLTGQAGRSKRGRSYFAGAMIGDLTLGLWAATTVTNWTTVGTGIMGLYGPTGTDTLWQLMQWSETIAFGCRAGTTHPHDQVRFTAPSPSTAATAITSFKVRNVPYTQRRRVTGVGA